jgi:predicted component of type VI protein secretion system
MAPPATLLRAERWISLRLEIMEVQLLVRSKTGQVPREYVFPVKNRVVLGRSPESPVPLEGAAISREHVALELVGGAVYATDLSNNGTWINGDRLKREQRTQLENGDSMELPDYQISVQIRLPNATPAIEPPRARPESVTDPVAAPPPAPKPVRPVNDTALKIPRRSFSILEVWVLFLAVLAAALMIYYGFLVP